MQALPDPVFQPADSTAAMMDLIGGKPGASTVFGEPVTVDGITVIPVARAGIAFGGADGGVGGGADIRPLGYLEIRDGVARYHPIRDTWGHVVVPLAALAAGLAAPWMIHAASKFRRPRR
ncbi:hypothetical protein OG203_42870 [Nocardia sp. NBC_01499]|uniref:hypothetical protein n=1 Tax=Nocardia sp. NBC_01499 TaxID=2903597 RepID=UPI003863A31C